MTSCDWSVSMQEAGLVKLPDAAAASGYKKNLLKKLANVDVKCV